MARSISRRDALKQVGVAGAGLVFAGAIRGRAAPIMVAGRPVEIAVWSVSPVTARIIVHPTGGGGGTAGVPVTGALVEEALGSPVAAGAEAGEPAGVVAGDLVIRYDAERSAIDVETRAGERVQSFTLGAEGEDVSFLLPDGPLLGLGEGGAQFDRKGAFDPMRNGQGGRSEGPRPYRLSTHGTRAPVQWLIGTDGWAVFIHQPYGELDLTGTDGRFSPHEDALPLDLFVIASRDPHVIMREYARITGLPVLPARWAFGYQQSSRTLAGRDEILGIARRFREERLPCDALIYLGTDFAPSGWNTRNGEFTWHPENFPDPKAMLDQLHEQHFRVIVHIVVEGRRLTGTVDDPCTAPPLPPGRTEDDEWPRDRQVACYWPAHEPLMDVGVDGWWPDQGDGFDGPSRLNRHRMYWEGTQRHRPNERPFALHRNASPGIQRYGGFIWTGDPRSRWETLANHVGVGINSGLSGFPYWGSDIGGFNPTDEYTAELHVRWFQFGTFCPSFRAHGRHWHLKLPWGWHDSEGGPFESRDWRVDPAELNNPRIQPIIKKYLELRYRLLPYTYTAARETHETGLPMIRALWLHYPDDPAAVGRGDEFLWGRDVLVAPVIERGARSRRVYLPAGDWYDFWTEERVAGGREVERDVDLETMPLYVRAGAVLPVGPVKQYADEQVDEALTLLVCAGASDTSHLYHDDGISFDHRDGALTRLVLDWDDAGRTLTIRPGPGSRMLPTTPRRFDVRLAGGDAARPVTFSGEPVSIQL